MNKRVRFDGRVTSPNQVTRYERKNIWQIIGFISVLILIFAYKLGIDVIPFYNIQLLFVNTTKVEVRLSMAKILFLHASYMSFYNINEKWCLALF